jgi:hypothetical protein
VLAPIPSFDHVLEGRFTNLTVANDVGYLEIAVFEGALR